MIKLGGGELIHVESWISELLPRAFRWRGRRHTVRLVESVPRGTSPRDGVLAGQRLVSLRTSNGLRCVLLHDSRAGTWSMKQVLTRKEGGRDARRNAMV